MTRTDERRLKFYMLDIVKEYLMKPKDKKSR